MAMNLTRPVGTVVSDNAPVGKGPMRDLLNDLVSAIEGKAEIQDSGKLFFDRASAVSAGQEKLVPAIGRIFTVEGDNLVLRGQGQTGDDPLFATQPRWGVVDRYPARSLLDALASDLATRRIASTANGSFAGTTFPTGTTTVLFRNGGNAALWARVEGAPPAPVPASFQQDQAGQWWERVWQASDIRGALGNAGVFSLRGIGGTANAITATLSDAAIAAGISVGSDTTVEIVPTLANTGTVTLKVGADNARTIKTETGAAAPAGFLRPGVPVQLRRVNADWRALPSVTSDQLTVLRNDMATADALEASARAKADGDLREAIRAGAVIPLVAIGGTGDAWSADLAPAVVAAGITSLSGDATVEYIPALPNAGSNPTGTIAGTSFGIRNADGAAWPAFGFTVGRSYTLRRRGSQLRVIGDVAQPDLAAARLDRITGDAQMGSVMLEGIAGTGDAITATMPGTLSAIGIAAANIREVIFPVPAANTTGTPTLNIDGQGAVPIRDHRDGTLPAGALVPGPLYRAVKVAGRWRIVTSEVDRAALQAAVATEAVARNAAIEAGDLRIMSEDRDVTHVGATRAVIEANAAASQANTINWIFPTAIAAGGDVGRFRAQVAVAGLVHLGVYRRIGDNLVRRGFRAVFLPAGQVDVPVALSMQAGDFLGAFMGTARLRFLSNGGTGYYFSNSSTEQTSIAASSLNTTNLLLAQFILYQGQSALSQEREALRDTVADLSGRVVSLEYGGRDLQTFGTTDEARLADPSASPAAEWNFVFDDARPAGPVVEVELHARAAGTLRLKTGVLAGGSYATRASVSLDVVEGHNVIKTRLEMREGEMLAYKASARMVPFQSNGPLGTETATWYNGSTADLDSFSATLNATQQHLVKFTQAIGASEGEETARAGDLAEAGLGRISHARSGNDVTVSVSALGIAGTETLTTSTFTIPPTSTDFRYDLIVYDHGTQTLSRLAGAQRNDAANAQPVLTGASRQAVMRIRAGTAGITSVIAIPEMSGAVPLAARAMLDRRIAGARRACPKLMDKIFRRQPIRIMGFGDSITALGSGGSKWTANGSVRDAITGPYLANSGIVDAAVIAAVPLFTAGELGRGDDGGGRIHSRIGINWEFVRALEARGWVLGTDLWYDNFAIPGTSSTDMWDDAANAPTDWLAALPMAGGARPDVVIFANAMNERPYAAGREERTFRIVDWIRSQGIEVIITTCARAATGLGDTRHANERLSRVARATGSGLIPLEAIWEDAVIGALGVNPEDLCLANRSNHPGIIELTRYGRILAEVVP